jgi:hypothetical protein
VALQWTGSTGATSYNLYRGTAAGAESAIPIATGITPAAYTNISLTNWTTYYYKVAAVNAAGTSPMSNEASAKPVPGITVTICNVDGGSTVAVADVQGIVNQAFGTSAKANDVNSDGVVNVVDVQAVINAALGLGCSR